MTPIKTPDVPAPEDFATAEAAVARLEELYETATAYLCKEFSRVLEHGAPGHRIRAFYPEIRLTTSSFAQVDTRLSFGHVAEPGTHKATVTRPDLFKKLPDPANRAVDPQPCPARDHRRVEHTDSCAFRRRQ